MITNILWLLELVREEILETFILPELEISYWDFCIYLAIAAIVITVLINAVQVSGGSAISASENRKRNASLLKEKQERESYGWYKANRERNEAYDDRYRSEHGQKLRKR